jgi:multidrug efflux pump subunit AcrA (membrane-fusion protein)
MKSVIRGVLVMLSLGALVAGGYWIYQNRFASAATTEDDTYRQVVTVDEGVLTASLSVVGQLEAVQSADLTFEAMSGTAKVQSLAAATGQTVTGGQVLATIDPTPYQQALDEAKSSMLCGSGVLPQRAAHSMLCVRSIQFWLNWPNSNS